MCDICALAQQSYRYPERNHAMDSNMYFQRGFDICSVRDVREILRIRLPQVA